MKTLVTILGAMAMAVGALILFGVVVTLGLGLAMIVFGRRVARGT